MAVPKDRYTPGQVVQQTGIYRIVHKRHRSAHETILVRGMKFPACHRCGDAVRFSCVAGVPDFRSGHSNRNMPALLLVDNEPVVASTLQWVLEQEGYRVSTAQNFPRAVGL